jgi:hypothetical protein
MLLIIPDPTMMPTLGTFGLAIYPVKVILSVSFCFIDSFNFFDNGA